MTSFEDLVTTGEETLISKVVTILDEYFPSGKISIGSLSRKIPYLLISICQQTRRDWEVAVEYLELDRVFGIVFRTFGDTPCKLLFKITPLRNRDIIRDLDILNSLFRKDKYLDEPVQYAKIMLKTTHGNFVYSKATGTNKWKFMVSCDISFMTRLRGLLHSDDIKVLSHEVLESVALALSCPDFEAWKTKLLQE